MDDRLQNLMLVYVYINKEQKQERIMRAAVRKVEAGIAHAFN